MHTRKKSSNYFDWVVKWGGNHLSNPLVRAAYRIFYPLYMSQLSKKFRAWANEIGGVSNPVKIDLKKDLGFELMMQLDLSNTPGRFTHDMIMYHLLLSTGSYEPDVTSAIAYLIGPGDVFVDAGANNGFFSLVASQLVGPTGVVHSFEPNSIVFSRLKTNVTLNHLNNVQLHNEALSDQDGSALLDMRFPEDGLASLVSWRRKRIEQTDNGFNIVKVPTKKLDSIIANTPVSLIKMDVEGAELLALQGAKNIISKNPNLKVIMEFRAYYDNSDLIAFIYEFFKVARIQMSDGVLSFQPLTAKTLAKGHALTLLLFNGDIPETVRVQSGSGKTEAQ